jgi:hypothetical protein
VSLSSVRTGYCPQSSLHVTHTRDSSPSPTVREACSIHLAFRQGAHRDLARRALAGSLSHRTASSAHLGNGNFEPPNPTSLPPPPPPHHGVASSPAPFPHSRTHERARWPRTSGGSGIVPAPPRHRDPATAAALRAAAPSAASWRRCGAADPVSATNCEKSESGRSRRASGLSSSLSSPLSKSRS